MSGFLIDTNVLSEFSRRQGPDPVVVSWLKRTPREEQHISVITLAEIDRGIQLLPTGRRRTALESWLTTNLERWFDGRVLAVDRTLAAQWASLQALSSKAGRTLPTLDSLIAASALVHQLALATRNVRDFDGLGIEVVDPWDA